MHFSVGPARAAGRLPFPHRTMAQEHLSRKYAEDAARQYAIAQADATYRAWKAEGLDHAAMLARIGVTLAPGAPVPTSYAVVQIIRERQEAA